MPAGMEATLTAVTIQVLFFILSIGGAWIVLVYLKGTANIRHKGAQFGGAAAMFVAMFLLLNKYVPELRDALIKEARAGTQQVTATDLTGKPKIVEISISPERQKITKCDLLELDRNKYFIDEELEVAVQRPTNSKWTAGRLDSFDRVSVVDIPLLGMGIAGMSNLLPLKTARRPIFGVRDESARELVIGKDSIISGVTVGTNPFEDEKFLRNSIQMQLDMAARMSNELDDPMVKEQLIDNMIAGSGDMMKEGFNAYLEKALPITKKIRNGVFVTSIEIESAQDIGFRGQLISSMSPLDKAVNVLAMNGQLLAKRQKPKN